LIGIIGGTGVYDPELLENAKTVRVHTPYGATSCLATIGKMHGKDIAFIPRHGSNHTIPPHKVNFRANIDALKQLGCERVIGTCAVGSLRKKMKPGSMVFPDQFIDWGKQVHTFYDEGKFYHTWLADPFCPELRSELIKIARQQKIKAFPKATYARIEGPQFSTRAASKMYKQFADIIGMTGVPEAILCREKEMCYAIIATVTDYDVALGTFTPFEEIKKNMAKNLANTKRVLSEIIRKMPDERECACKTALTGAEA
jgi:5'-methylthioadenosine phosphorylase